LVICSPYCEIEDLTKGRDRARIYPFPKYVWEGKRYVDYREAKSLRLAEGWKLNIKQDKNYPLRVLDWNAHQIIVGFEKFTVLGKDIPVKIYEPDPEKTDPRQLTGNYKEDMRVKATDSIRFSAFDTVQDRTYAFGVNDVLEYGPNSTTIYPDVGSDC